LSEEEMGILNMILMKDLLFYIR